MITAAQMRAARALLGIDQRQLADLSGVSLPTIQRMEASDGTVRGVVDTLMKVIDAFDAAGVELIGDLRTDALHEALGRAPIEDAGLGEYFRHRMGHGIGLDVHEQPFISVEDETVLEAGMTFTDEPSILWDGHFAVRIEDIVVCADGGGRVLNQLSSEAVVNA